MILTTGIHWIEKGSVLGQFESSGTKRIMRGPVVRQVCVDLLYGRYVWTCCTAGMCGPFVRQVCVDLLYGRYV